MRIQNKGVQMEKYRTIRRYGTEPEFTRKTDEPYRMDVDPNMTEGSNGIM